MQLALPIHQLDDETLDNFYAESNPVLLDSLRKNFTAVQQPFFYLWGSRGSGKSHLLKAVSHHYWQENRSASYISLQNSRHFSPMVLENAEQLELICLDDLNAIAGDEEWELAIFNLFNQIQEQQSLFQAAPKTLLLVSADCPPNQLNIRLPDLRSRLSWGETHSLAELSDEQKQVILQRKAHQKGLDLSDEVASFLLKRLNRDLHTLSNQLNKLERASIQAKRKLTLPFVKEILAL